MLWPLRPLLFHFWGDNPQNPCLTGGLIQHRDAARARRALRRCGRSHGGAAERSGCAAAQGVTKHLGDGRNGDRAPSKIKQQYYDRLVVYLPL